LLRVKNDHVHPMIGTDLFKDSQTVFSRKLINPSQATSIHTSKCSLVSTHKKSRGTTQRSDGKERNLLRFA
jgi:hypothetical protein